jgi:hypothetical protein
MAGYLDEFGVKDAQRERRNRRIVISTLLAAIVGVSAFFYFRDWSEERAVDRFLTLLKQQKYQEAYKMWETPESAKFYPPEKFTEDWGPKGGYQNAAALKIEDVDTCGTGVVFNVAYPGADNFGLYVDRSTGVISFAPWPRCPGAHLQIWRFIKSRFGGG